MNVDFVNEREAKELLAWFLHYLEQDQRSALAATYPQHYNKLCGREVVRVVRPDGSSWRHGAIRRVV